MKILTSDEVRRAEREAIKKQDLSTLLLMQRAGFSVAQFCLINFKFDSVCVVCGKGNNGGDGFVAASGLLEMGKQVKVVVLARAPSELSADAAHWCERLSVKPLWISKESDFKSKAVQQALAADLMIDAIFGIGFKPPLRGVAKRAVEIMNDFRGEIVCVDVPTGVDADSTQPPSADQDAVLVTGACTQSVLATIAGYGPELMTAGLAETSEGTIALAAEKRVDELLTGKDVIVLGPGLSRNAETAAFIRQFAGHCPLPLVLDADGLN